MTDEEKMFTRIDAFLVQQALKSQIKSALRMAPSRITRSAGSEPAPTDRGHSPVRAGAIGAIATFVVAFATAGIVGVAHPVAMAGIAIVVGTVSGVSLAALTRRRGPRGSRRSAHQRSRKGAQHE